MKRHLTAALLLAAAMLLVAACGTAATGTPDTQAPVPTATATPPTEAAPATAVSPTVTPGPLPPTAIPTRPQTDPPTPTATQLPTAPPSASTVPRPEVVIEGPAALLARLPGDSTGFYFFEVAPLLGRDDLHEGGLTEALEYLTKRTEGVLTEEIMLRAVDRVAIGQGRGSGVIGGAAILQGDFRPIVAALRDAAAAADQEVIEAEEDEVYRETLIVKVSGGPRFPDDAYLALLEPATVVMGPTVAHVYPQLDGQLEEGLRPVTGDDALEVTARAALTPVSLGDYMGIEIFRTHYRNYSSNFYIAVPDPSTMLFARAHGPMTAMIERYLSAEEVGLPLSALLEGTGQVDFLFITVFGERFGVFGKVNDDGTTKVEFRMALEDEQMASQVEARIQERREKGRPIEDLVREGVTVRYTMELPDSEVGSTLFGN